MQFERMKEFIYGDVSKCRDPNVEEVLLKVYQEGDLCIQEKFCGEEICILWILTIFLTDNRKEKIFVYALSDI